MSDVRRKRKQRSETDLKYGVIKCSFKTQLDLRVHQATLKRLTNSVHWQEHRKGLKSLLRRALKSTNRKICESGIDLSASSAKNCARPFSPRIALFKPCLRRAR